jgi:hypothetical protein
MKREGLTVEQLVDEDKVVLHALLVELAKVGLWDADEAVDEFEHQGSWGVRPDHTTHTIKHVSGRQSSSSSRPSGQLYIFGWGKEGGTTGWANELCDGEDVDIVDSDVEEGGRAEGDDGTSNICVRHDLDPEDVRYRPSTNDQAEEKERTTSSAIDLPRNDNEEPEVRKARTWDLYGTGERWGPGKSERVMSTNQARGRDKSVLTSPFWLKMKKAWQATVQSHISTTASMETS